MTRRELIATAAALSAAAVVRATQSRVRFGVRGPLPEGSLRRQAELLERLGYDGIELGPEWLDQPADRIREQLGARIAVSAIVGSLELLNTDAKKRAQAVNLDRRRLEMAKQLGADAVIEVPVFGPNRFQDISPLMTPREVEERLLVAGLKQLAPDVARTGITLLLEPLNRKETHFMTLQGHGADVIRAVGAPGFKLLTDFYHAALEEPDLGETLGRYGKCTGYAHLADAPARNEPGSLSFDYRPGFRALKKWGYSGWLTVESGATDNPEAALARALKYVKQQWNEA